MGLTKGCNIFIHLETVVEQAGEKNNFYFDLSGQIIKMNDTLYIRYKEEQLDGVQIPVTIKIEPDGKIQLIRSGDLRMRLKFDYQETSDTTYRTPYGLFEISTFTRDLRFSLQDQPLKGSILIDYDLFSQQIKIGEYRLKLEFHT